MIDRTRNRHGFTLLEMLVSAVILAIVIAGFSSLFSYATFSWNDTVKAFERNANYRSAADQIASDCRSALPFFDADPMIGMKGWSHPTDAQLPFTATGHVNDVLSFHLPGYAEFEGASAKLDTGVMSDITKVTYRGHWSGGALQDTRLVMGYTNEEGTRTLYLNLDNNIPGAPRDFAYNVDTFCVQYFNGASWQNSWDTTVATLPKLMRITMGAMRGKDTYLVVTVVHPAADDGYTTP